MLINSYYGNGMQVIDVIQLFGMGFERGNMIKYIARAGVKDVSKIKEDIHKANTYNYFYRTKTSILRTFFTKAKYLYTQVFKASKFKEYETFLSELDIEKAIIIDDIVSGGVNENMCSHLLSLESFLTKRQQDSLLHTLDILWHSLDSK